MVDSEDPFIWENKPDIVTQQSHDPYVYRI